MAVGAFTLTNPGLLATQDGSIDPDTDAMYAALTTDAGGPPALTDATYADISAGITVDVDYAPQNVPLTVLGSTGTVAVQQNPVQTNFGDVVTISARYYWLLKGSAAAPAGGDLILGFMDLNFGGTGDVESLASDFKVSSNAANGLYQVTIAP